MGEEAVTAGALSAGVQKAEALSAGVQTAEVQTAEVQTAEVQTAGQKHRSSVAVERLMDSQAFPAPDRGAPVVGLVVRGRSPEQTTGEVPASGVVNRAPKVAQRGSLGERGR
jgi:hypothetical protein